MVRLVISSISRKNNTIPLYISDAWDLPRALEYTRRKNSTITTITTRGASKPPSNPIIIDTHRYHTFSSQHTSQALDELIHQIATTELSSELASIIPTTSSSSSVSQHHTATAILIGEWSCAALSPTTTTTTWQQNPLPTSSSSSSSSHHHLGSRARQSRVR